MSRLLKWTGGIGERTRGRYSDRGAGFVEYAGLLLLIATVVVAVVALRLQHQVADAIQGAVNRIFD